MLWRRAAGRTRSIKLHSHSLQVGGSWAQHIAAIRDAHSEDTNLIRFDNTFYRYARPGPPIEIGVVTRDGTAEARLIVDPTTFYMTPLTGQRVENYEPDLVDKTLSDESIDNAIHGIAKNSATQTVRSLLIFAVAESIRFDQLATEINTCFLADAGQLITSRLRNPDGSIAKGMKIGAWLRMVRCWGQASKAALAGVPPALRDDLERRRRRGAISERLDATGDAELDQCLHRMKLINRSTSIRNR